MFSAYCDGCATEVLLSTRRIVSLRHTDGGIVVIFRCWDGHLGSWLTGRRDGTGRGAAAPVAAGRAPQPAAATPAGRHAVPRLADVWREPRAARI